jgi:Bromodomain/TAZ zinc finger
MDVSTLKNRLQAIAHGLEVHRSNDSVAANSSKQSNSLTDGGRLGVGQNSNLSVASVSGVNSAGVTGLGGLLSQIDSGQISSASQQLSSRLNERSNTGQQGAMYQSNVSSENYRSGHIQQQAALHQNDPWSSGQGTNSESPVMSQSVGLEQQQDGRSFFAHGHSIGTDPSSSFQFDAGMFSANPTSPNVTSSFPNPSGLGDSNQQQHQRKNSWDSSSDIAGASNESEPLSSSMDFPNSSRFQDPSASQKMRVILQQQQRLLLLRHASKCTSGPQCPTKFCEQMVTLWKHMKTCRNKNCKKSHCLSSRCVLNHYRVCKSNSRTLLCEVCGPVMVKIKQQEREDETADDPLTRDQDISPAEQPSSFTELLPSSAYPQLSGNQSQLFQVQANHTRLKAQLDILKLLQKQQEQLLEQQKSLEIQAQNIHDPNSAQFLQLQEQQLLLQQLQKRCQQQQLLVQHELQMQTPSLADNHGQQLVASETTEPIDTVASNVQSTTSASLPQQNRMGNVGKRFGKSLVLPPARKSKSSENDGQANKNSSPPKKSKPSSKPKTVAAREPLKPDGDTRKKIAEDQMSLLSCMSPDEINKHIESLNKQIILSSRTVTHKCRPIIQELLDDQFGWVFHDAVDPVALGLPDYFDVIKNPMHMDLVRKKLESAIYSDMESFARDMRLVFQNAILYNGESSEVGELAQSMILRFDKLYNAVVEGTVEIASKVVLMYSISHFIVFLRI